MQDTYDALMAHVRETIALSQVSGLLGWDQETMMPKGSAAQRGEWMGAMEAAVHARSTDPRVGDWLSALDGTDLGEEAAANLHHIKRSFDRNTKVPAELAAEIARVTSVSQGIWAGARAEDYFKAFAPTLRQVLELRRQEARALSGDGAWPHPHLLRAVLDVGHPRAGPRPRGEDTYVITSFGDGHRLQGGVLLGWGEGEKFLVAHWTSSSFASW